MEEFDQRMDDYIARSAAFAQPVLIHLRELVHQAYPGIKETMKWSMPFFDHKGTVCYMAAFKQHCAFGFWKASRLADKHQIINKGAETSAGSFGRIATLGDLPADDILIAYIQEAAALNEQGVKAPPRVKPTANKGVLIIPEDFAALLDENEEAQTNFEKFSHTKQKEYVEWFNETKSAATRQKRMQTAIEWIAENKGRHWKYQ